MTPYLRTDGPIHGRTPRTDTPGQAKVVRFPTPARPEREEDWRNRSACRNEDPEIFFATGTGAAAERATAEAKTICARCDVIADCGIFLAHMQATLPGAVEGVWAGTSHADRERQARREQRARERERAEQRKQAAA